MSEDLMAPEEERDALAELLDRSHAREKAADERAERLRSAAAWFLNELDEGQMPDAGNLRAAIDDYDAARGEG